MSRKNVMLKMKNGKKIKEGIELPNKKKKTKKKTERLEKI